MRYEENYWKATAARRLSRRRALSGAALGGAGLAAASIVGCGGDDDQPASSATAATTSQGGGGAATPVIQKGGKIQWGHSYPEGALTLDPHTQESDGSQMSIRFMYSNLLREREDKGPGERELAGDLVESWQRPDPLTAIFKLRPGVKFQNLPPVSGRALTAEDVVYSYQRMKTDNPKFVMRSTFAMIDSIQAVSNDTVKMTTAFPFAPLLHNIAYPWASIVAREVVEKGDIENKPVGTGPFMLDEYVRGATIRYKRNPDYFRAGLPYADALETPIMPDASARIAAFRSGQFAWVSLAAPQVADVKKTNSDANFIQAATISGSVIRFNCQDDHWKDERVRQAIAYATNVQDYIDAVGGGSGIRMGPMPMAIKTWAVKESDLPQFDLAKAKQLMSAAGVEGGFSVTSSATQPYTSVDLTEITKAQLKKINIDVKIDVLDNAAWIDKSYRASGFSFSTYADYAYSDPDRGLRDHYHSKGGNNNMKFSDPDIDKLLDRQREVTDEKERQSIVMDAQKKIIAKAPRVWLYTGIGTTAIQPWLQNYHQYIYEAGNTYQQYDELWLKKQA